MTYIPNIDYWTRHAINVIKDNYGDDVVIKDKNLLKFGENTDVDVNYETVWNVGGDEAYAIGNNLDSISSSNDADTQLMKIEGHTIDGFGNLTFRVQSKTLTGRTPATLDTPLYRVTRLYNADTTNFAGDIYIYDLTDGQTLGVPAIGHIKATAEHQQSMKCATAFSSVDYGLITSMTASVNKKTTTTVDFILQIKDSTGVFRTAFPISANSTGGSVQVDFYPFIIVPKNGEIRIRARAGTAGASVNASFNVLLATIPT